MERVFGAMGSWLQCQCYSFLSHVTERTEWNGVESGEKNEEGEPLDSGVKSHQVIAELSSQQESDRWF